MTRQPRTYKLIGQRPGNVPADWLIFNAPRPLLGHTTWTGDFIHGIFYAAIDPADDYVAPGWIDSNVRDHGYLLEWVDTETAIREAWQYYVDNFPKVVAEHDPADPEVREMLLREYLRKANKQ